MATMRQTARLYLRIGRSRIHFLKFILEAYDGMAVLSVVDVGLKNVMFRFAPENIREVVALLSCLACRKNLM